MTGLQSIFKDGVKKENKRGLYHCTACDNGGWYIVGGDCPHCEEELEKML